VTGPEQRRAAVRALVDAQAAVPGVEPQGMVGWLSRLCRAAVHELPATGAGISVMTAAGVRAVAAASDAASAALEEAQFALGEGPCIGAFSSRRPVLEPDLHAGAVTGTGAASWPGYLAAAQAHGVRAVFAFPLQIGAARLGVLGVYRDFPGVLSPGALAKALTFAEVAVEALLDGQEQATAGATEATLERALDSQFTVYQAQGMAMVDLGVSLADAMARLQAHAYAQDRSLHEIALDVVAGRLRLESDEP
jgi:ANTAR domain